MARSSKQNRRWPSPEIEHLQRAVDAVKTGLYPQKEREPQPEPNTEPEEESPPGFRLSE